MGFWFAFFMWAASFVLADYFRKPLPGVSPSGLGDFEIPTATEGRPVPVMFGRMRVGGSNVTWYGDFRATPVEVTTGVIFRRDEIIGYTYELALQLTQLRGQVEGMTGVWIGDDKVWDAEADNSGNPATLVDINRPDLFGGEKKGGGFVGRLRCHTGALDQPVSAFLATRQTPTPAYGGFTYVVVSSLDETRGANIGESNTLRLIRIEFQTYSTLANGGLGNSLGLIDDKHIIGEGLNPIVAAYDVFTGTDNWRGLPIADVNLANFRATAETIFDEGLGFSLLIDQVTSADETISQIEQHIDGYIGPDPVTGQLEVKLARQDYVLANEFQADGSVVESVSKFSRGEWHQTFNEFRLQYTDREKDYKDGYAPSQDMANRIIQGRTKSKTTRYPGVHSADVANKISWRTLRGLSQPLASATVEMKRRAYQLRPGAVFSLTDEDVGVTNLPMRVTSVGVGDPLKATLSVDAVEDVYGAETTGFADPPPSGWTGIDQSVVAFAAADQVALEAPRLINRQDPTSPGAHPRLYTMARLTGGAAQRYEIIRRTRTPPTAFSGAYVSTDEFPEGFCTVGQLRNAVGGWETGNGALTLQVDPVLGSLDTLIGSYTPEGVGQLAGVAVIDPGTDEEEWLAFTAVVDDGAGIQLQGLWRGCLDTGMRPHSAGDRVWFIWTGGQGLPLEVFTPGDGVDVKLLPSSQTETLVEGSATALAEVSLLDPPRYSRPLMPRTLFLDSAPAVELPSTGNANQHVGDYVPGLVLSPRLRSWRTLDVIDSVQGLTEAGNALTASDLTAEDMALEFWLYDLDTTPAPARGDAVASGSGALTALEQQFLAPRADMVSAGVSADFNARLEVEITHSPPGEEADQPSRPLFFDFVCTGQFTALPQPSFANVSLLLGFNGTDGATATSDESTNGHTVTFLGSAALDDEFVRFGTTALLLPLGDGDGIEVAVDSTLTLGGDDFCIEFVVLFPAESVGTYNPVLNVGVDSAISNRYQMEYFGATSELEFRVTGLGVLNLPDWDPEPGVWYHWAMVRDGNNFVGYLDGVPFDTVDVTGLTASALSGTSLRLGRRRSGDPWADCSIDEFRFTLGEPIYTAAFGPPTAAHPRS